MLGPIKRESLQRPYSTAHGYGQLAHQEPHVVRRLTPAGVDHRAETPDHNLREWDDFSDEWTMERPNPASPNHLIVHDRAPIEEPVQVRSIASMTTLKGTFPTLETARSAYTYTRERVSAYMPTGISWDDLVPEVRHYGDRMSTWIASSLPVAIPSFEQSLDWYQRWTGGVREQLDVAPAWVKTGLQVGTVPVALGSTIAAGAYFYDDSTMVQNAVLLASSLLAFVPATVLESVMPSHESWMRPAAKEVQRDILSGVLNTGVASAVGMMATTAATTALFNGAIKLMGETPAPVGAEIPWYLTFVATILAADFMIYWGHRAEHNNMYLWYTHEWHHAQKTGMRSLHALRNSILNVKLLASQAFVTGLNLLGRQAFGVEILPEDALFMATLFTIVNGAYTHTSAEVKYGLLKYLINSVEAHRFHHSLDMKEGNTNNGGHTVIWDHIFGTFYLPEDKDGPDEVGISAKTPDGYWANVVRPFAMWLKMLKKKKSRF